MFFREFDIPLKEIKSVMENPALDRNQIFIEHYGSMDAFKEQFLKNASSEQAQMNFAKVVEWYGNKESALDAMNTTKDSDVLTAYQKRMDVIQKKISDKIGTDVNSLEVKELIGEYDFVAKQLYQMKDVTNLMLGTAKEYKNNKDIQAGIDSVYGAGSAFYMGEVIEAFYNK